MTKLILKGWRSDLVQKPVSLSDLLREELGLTLPAAKRIIDDLADSGTALVEVKAIDAAHRFRRRAVELGVVCELTE